MLDLHNNKYDRETLKQCIYAIKLVDIVKTQIIDATFAVRYLLNSKYYIEDNEIRVTPKMILYYQKHITEAELISAMALYDSDDDSIEDFEKISNRN